MGSGAIKIMADGKPQSCRNGCGRQIYVSDRSGKWLPYNVDNDNKHDCPNYGSKPASNTSTFKKTDTLGKIAELETEVNFLKTEISELHRTQANFAKEIASMSYKKGTEVEKTT